MSRIRLLGDDELTPAARDQAQAVEAAGRDASVLRAVGLADLAAGAES